MFIRSSSRSIASNISSTGTRFHQASISSTRLSRYPGRSNPKFAKRDSSSSIPPPDDQPSASSSLVPDAQPAPPPPSLPEGDALGIEKQRRRRTIITVKSSSPDDPPDAPSLQNGNAGGSGDGPSSSPHSQLPASLEILWSPESNPRTSTASDPQNANLPPSEIFEDVLDNLHVTFHPKTQHRATYTPQEGGSTVEPTLALYCPIEGGDYVIDETVKELAKRVGADVVVLDCVQLAAGSAGQFGQAASVLQLPDHPLHFQVSPTSPSQSSSKRSALAAEDEDYYYPGQFPTAHMTVHLMTPPVILNRVGTRSVSRTTQPKLKSFFDDLINVTPPPADADGTAEGSTSSSPSPRKPRIVYVRDFNTLAASASHWYPALLQSVRQRRAGPIARTTSPVLNPTTIVFGVTPPLVPKVRPSKGASGAGGVQSATNVLTNQRSAYSSERERAGGSKKSENGRTGGKGEWGEDESSDHAREKRLKERLKKWEEGEKLLLADELPTLQLNSSASEDPHSSRTGASSSEGGFPGLAGIGASGLLGPFSGVLPGAVLQNLMSSPDPRSGSGPSSSSPSVDATDGSTSPSNFFRSSVVVPSQRSVQNEKISRMNRRREINEVTVRMALASVGGTLPPLDAESLESALWKADADEIPLAKRADLVRMWDAWGRVVVVWSVVKQAADRALGSVLVSQQEHELQDQQHAKSRRIPKLTLDPTVVPWGAVARALVAKASGQSVRRHWAKETAKSGEGEERGEEGASADGRNGKEEELDEVIEKLKQDPDLDEHEQRLLGCIVDPRTLTSTFGQVHLPPHTIDSVRSIVSLPLLHPHAFQYGILKDHGITGCLLFGPPGTGKTLVVRALAKEAECRMLAVAPSDVMDMYVGEGEKLVKAVFSLARRLSPCVVFIDEIDSLFGARVSSRETGGALAHRGVITEFMSEMDGLRSSSQDQRVVVIGATNRPFDLDDAVLRRLPRRLLVDLPGEKERKEILKILLKGENVAEDVSLDEMAKRTGDFSGSDLKHLCVAAALDAVKAGVVLPWEATKPTTDGVTPVTPAAPTADASSEDGTRVLVLENDIDAWDEPLPSSDAKPASPETEPTTPERPPRVISLSNFEKALKEITPSSSESLGTLSELRKWNDEFGEGKREKKRNMWGKGSFGFIEKGEGQGEIKIATSAGSTSTTTSGGGGSSVA
ncbi:AAA-domain-containing protein [Thelephora terrestris]|uniref:AAA-domain-containing protein n=1 Tax=Thelephora terrestris TaxID=56493 RepID=A0A9P6H8J9_9AGAM|nr:AAA-domain-containing protein [Thelephora terrestris]